MNKATSKIIGIKNLWTLNRIECKLVFVKDSENHRQIYGGKCNRDMTCSKEICLETMNYVKIEKKTKHRTCS